MQNLEGLARRIDSTRDLQSIVRTMKLLSSVSIRRYEAAARAIAEYRQSVELGLQIVLRDVDLPDRDQRAPDGPVAAIIFGSDLGLCGRFNEQIVDFAVGHLSRLQPQSDGWLLLAMGDRVDARLAAQGRKAAASYLMPGTVDMLTDAVGKILLTIDAWQHERGVEQVLIFHQSMTETGVLQPRMTRLMPMDLQVLRALAERRWQSRRLPMFTMDADTLFAALVRQYLFASIHRGGAESRMAEHAARLAAMQAAEKNIAERLDELGTTYSRERQDAITAELLDVVAGFEALSTGRA